MYVMMYSPSSFPFLLSINQPFFPHIWRFHCLFVLMRIENSTLCSICFSLFGSVGSGLLIFRFVSYGSKSFFHSEMQHLILFCFYLGPKTTGSCVCTLSSVAAHHDGASCSCWVIHDVTEKYLQQGTDF